jgi:hypothetical protein
VHAQIFHVEEVMIKMVAIICQTLFRANPTKAVFITFVTNMHGFTYCMWQWQVFALTCKPFSDGFAVNNRENK